MSTLVFTVIMIILATANAIKADGPRSVPPPEPPKGANGPSEFDERPN